MLQHDSGMDHGGVAGAEGNPRPPLIGRERETAAGCAVRVTPTHIPLGMRWEGK
jgi:hypothetical protein